MAHSLELESSGRYEEALASLAAALEANRHRDHDGWLARSIARDRMMILVDAGRYAEALEASRDWQQIGFENVSQRWMHATATGHALEGLGRDDEAVAVLEHSLGYQDEKYLPSVLGVLTELVRFSEKLGVPVNPKWLPIAEALANKEGVDMPSAPSPAAAILALEEVLRALPPEERMKRYRERAEAKSS